MGDEVVILANSLISHFKWGLRHSEMVTLAFRNLRPFRHLIRIILRGKISFFYYPTLGQWARIDFRIWAQRVTSLLSLKTLDPDHLVRDVKCGYCGYHAIVASMLMWLSRYCG